MEKKALSNFLEAEEAILEKNEVKDSDLLEKIEKLKKEIFNYKAKILFVGGFSAGKTALVNCILGGEEFFKENQTAETAVATEIIFGNEERIIRVELDGTETLASSEELANTDSSKFLKYIYFINNQNLKLLNDKVLVDMPGFDSGIEEHNKALLQYIEEASAYVFVVDITKGTLSESAINFLEEIQEYATDVIFVLTKCDKLIAKDIDEVTENIKGIVSGIYEKTIDILRVSSRDGGTGKLLVEAINALPGCFITTATCNATHKGDNCEELMLMRNCRDFMRKKYKIIDVLINEYYRIAPMIVDKINDDIKYKEVYEKLWNNYICDSVTLIKNNKFYDATIVYIDMVMDLSRIYGIPLAPGIQDNVDKWLEGDLL